MKLSRLCVIYFNMRHRIYSFLARVPGLTYALQYCVWRAEFSDYSFRACADQYTETFSGGAEIIEIATN